MKAYVVSDKTSWALGALKQFWYYGDMLDSVISIYDF